MHLPKAPEVALLIDPNYSRSPQRQFVCVMRNPSGEHEDDTKIFPVHHRGYIPMAYPLLFPFGTYGWGLYTENNGGRKTPHLPYFRFHLMMRFNHQNYLHVSNKLFQQLLVDEYERIEWGRLQWFHSCHHTI